ncbi:MAG: hypothetical protein JNK57_20730 [Planctomycetaceae bacterium]|nr:hypothetical protein [Planctomycetaceae bacterium]
MAESGAWILDLLADGSAERRLVGSDTRPHQALLTRLTAKAKRRSAHSAIRFGRFEAAQLMGGTDSVVDRSAIRGPRSGPLQLPNVAW